MNIYYHNGNIHCMDTPGKRIRALRKNRTEPVSQVQLAKLVGVDQSTISDIENDKGLSAENMMLICEALETSPQYVMRGVRDDVLDQIKQLLASPNQRTSSQINTEKGNPSHMYATEHTKLNPRTNKKALADIQEFIDVKTGANRETDKSRGLPKPKGRKAA